MGEPSSSVIEESSRSVMMMGYWMDATLRGTVVGGVGGSERWGKSMSKALHRTRKGRGRVGHSRVAAVG